MTDHQPVAAAPTMFRAPADRLQQARSAQTTMLVLGIVVGGGFVALAVWTLGGKSADIAISLVFGLGGLGILVAVVMAAARWRRNIRQAIGDDGIVFAADAGGLALGAFGRVAWSDVAEIVFTDQRTSGGGDFQGTPAAYGRRLGVQLRQRGGKCETDISVTLRGGAEHAENISESPAAGETGMSSTSNGRTVIRLPFGAALPIKDFHDANRVVEPVAATHGAELLYDHKARFRPTMKK